MSIFFQKRNRFVIMYLAVVMVFTIITACGNSTNSPTSAKDAKPSETEKVTPTTKEPTTVEEIALYEGANRAQRLEEAAKKEGTLNIYTSLPLEDMQKITDAFKQKYGIKTNIWRAGSENVTQRIITEAQGKKYEFDVVAGASAQIEALSREKLLQKVNSPHIKNLIEEAVPKHKEWVPIYLNIFVQAYNTNSVKKENLPKTYQDLLDPKWKGRIAIESTDDDWFSAVVNQMGEEKGLQYFKNLSANGLSVRTGHTLLTQLVAAGEVPYGLTVFSYKARQLKQEGAPLDWYVIEPAIARSTAVAISKKGPHPNASVLFYDFLLSDGQKILTDMFYDPANKEYQSASNKIPMKLMDDQVILDERAKWSKLFEDVVVKKQPK